MTVGVLQIAKRVCIIADADESGRRHGKNIAGSLVPVAESVKMIEFLQVKDLTEWVEAGGTAKELAQIFSAIPPLDYDDVAGWWDPARSDAPPDAGARFSLARPQDLPDSRPTGQNRRLLRSPAQSPKPLPPQPSSFIPGSGRSLSK